MCPWGLFILIQMITSLCAHSRSKSKYFCWTVPRFFNIINGNITNIRPQKVELYFSFFLKRRLQFFKLKHNRFFHASIFKFHDEIQCITVFPIIFKVLVNILFVILEFLYLLFNNLCNLRCSFHGLEFLNLCQNLVFLVLKLIHPNFSKTSAKCSFLSSSKSASLKFYLDCLHFFRQIRPASPGFSSLSMLPWSSLMVLTLKN